MKSNQLAVIFDMDGLIIDSEPLWREAEMTVFKSIGFEFTEQMCIQTMGMRIDAVVNYWHQKLQWKKPTVNSVINSIENQVIELVNKHGKPLNGVIETIELLKKNNIPIAIASSSSAKIIEAVVHKLSIKDYFSVIHSAEKEKNGKPHPDVFLSAAEMLEVNKNRCIVLEDSNYGMQAAINAGMKVIVIPEKGTNPKWSKKANLKLNSLEKFTINHLIDL